MMTSDEIQQLVWEINNLEAERDMFRDENTRLRAALANSELPCIYCTLPKEVWATCQSGFPGCGRADDALGCPHLDMSMSLQMELMQLKNIS